MPSVISSKRRERKQPPTPAKQPPCSRPAASTRPPKRFLKPSISCNRSRAKKKYKAPSIEVLISRAFAHNFRIRKVCGARRKTLRKGPFVEQAGALGF